ncbi:GNAT family acetyltransferase [Amycolatopsis bartoniae]|uniref:GNAT family acetyltransferase n=1 Tax=Amycolatopsis bartoniae TaxID=941986 RepID=A0A8H9J6D5_9PSEU|nr:GNAT family acetyltransferase [Amycolatopsis bartoniae]
MVSEINIRRATAADVGPIVAMLADDPLGRSRESPDDLTPYERAFARVDADPDQLLAVADDDGEVVGTLQLTFIPGLSRQGATRALIEAVRVRADRRGDGLGGTLVKWAIDAARRRDCVLVQLTSDASRTAAHRFYLRLGFEQSHLGFKLAL